MSKEHVHKRLQGFSTKLIIIIIIAFCTTAFIFNRVPLSQYLGTEYIMHVPGNSHIRMRHYLHSGIHLALVCANGKFNTMAISTIKSIMFHRRKSYNITFHIFTDSEGERKISTSFNFTANYCAQLRIYQIEKLLEIGKNFLKKHKIVSTHYSGIYALSKAFIHELLPPNVSHILLIDTDILFIDDVYSIWQQFQLFQWNKTALGLVPWYPSVPIDYKYKGSKPDPFLTGIVLLDLNICRSIDFTRLLSQITETAYKDFGLRSLWTADQVVLSLFATYFSEYFVALPCFVNGHTYHYLKDGSTWKSSCNGEYPRTVHVVPSNDLLKQTHYFGHLYVFFNKMPMEWLSHCGKEEP